MNKDCHFIIYIPAWEFTDGICMSYYEDLAMHHPVHIIFDGLSPIPTSLFTVHNSTSKGLLHTLRTLPIESSEIAILRQGVYPTSQERTQAIHMLQNHDAIYVGKEYADDGFLMMNQQGFRLFNRIEPRLSSIGYGIAIHALWIQSGLLCTSITIKDYNIQQPDDHRTQICSNILRAWLAAKQIDYFTHHASPAWYNPITDKISIIIPAWNNLYLVQKCIKSIFKFTLHPFEVILVDNASEEPVSAWAKPIANQYSNFIYVRNSINHGFPQGCNIGIERATGVHTLLLNSDTIVTPYWLSMLVAGLRDPSIGLVSGMSCNIGLKEQCVESNPYHNTKELVQFAQNRNLTHHGLQIQSTLIVFLLVLIRDTLKNKIGGLDPIFSFGNCEDSDYCLRTFRAGFKAIIMQDVYIDHVGSASFQKQHFSYEQLIHQNIQHAVGKNIPQHLHEQYYDATIDERWGALRPFDSKWDVLPISMEDFTKESIPIFSPFETKHTVLIFPHPSSSWLKELRKLLQDTQFSVILRVDPPTKPYIDHVQKHCEDLSKEERKRVYLETSILPTHYRKSIYDLAKYYIRPTRFDAFYFMREIAYMNIEEIT